VRGHSVVGDLVGECLVRPSTSATGTRYGLGWLRGAVAVALATAPRR
jgi:hypothetical protein